jgi:hypothetical protein
MSKNTTERVRADTGDYSATKAPENRGHVESSEPRASPEQTPGGAAGAAVDIGMSALEPENVPSSAGKMDKSGSVPKAPGSSG